MITPTTLERSEKLDIADVADKLIAGGFYQYLLSAMGCQQAEAIG